MNTLFDCYVMLFFFSSRRRHTRLTCDWSSDVCSSDLPKLETFHENPLSIRPDRHGDAHAAFNPQKVSSAWSRTPTVPPTSVRSEERRVGKECRSRGSREQ